MFAGYFIGVETAVDGLICWVVDLGICLVLFIFDWLVIWLLWVCGLRRLVGCFCVF